MERDDYAPRPQADPHTHVADERQAGDLGKALLMAQHVADQTIAEARREAERLISEARVTSVEVTTVDTPVPAGTPGELEPLLTLIASLVGSITEGLTHAADQLDAVRVDVNSRLAILSAEFDRVRPHFTEPRDATVTRAEPGEQTA